MNTKNDTNAATPAVLSTELLGWIPVSEKMPTAGKRVLVYGYQKDPGYAWRIIAKWQPARTLDAEYWEDPPEDWWDEGGNQCLCPVDAWWEDPYTAENCGCVENVTHWMELPSIP